MEWDAFISHASEDMQLVALPLKERLEARGYRIWLDETELKVGDVLSEKINEGLQNSRFGIVILSPRSFRKSWPRRELSELMAREQGGRKVVLPVWHEIGQEEITSLGLEERVAANTKNGLDRVADRLAAAMGPRRPRRSDLVIWSAAAVVAVVVLAVMLPGLLGTGGATEPVRIMIDEPESRFVPARFRVTGRIEGKRESGTLSINGEKCPIRAFGRFATDLVAEFDGAFGITLSFAREGAETQTVQRSVVIDTVPPVIHIDWPKEGEAPVPGLNANVRGRVEEANLARLWISVDGEMAPVTTGDDGEFECPILLVANDRTDIVLSSADQADNRAVAARRAIVHRTPEGETPPPLKRGRFNRPTTILESPTPTARTVTAVFPKHRFEILREQETGDWLRVRTRFGRVDLAGWVRSQDVTIDDTRIDPRMVGRVRMITTVLCEREDAQSIVTLVSSGDRVELIGRDAGSEWLRVAIGNHEGWVKAECIAVPQGIPELPILK